MDSRKFKTVEEYFSSLSSKERETLEKLRNFIKEAAPDSEEVISYNMPAFRYHGILVYYAAHKDHVGFYPTSSPMVVFKKELSIYKTSKGAVQFPYTIKLPEALIKSIVKYRITEVVEKEKLKKDKRNNS